MDYLGLGRFTAYKVNRPLTQQERDDRLVRTRRSSGVVRDELSAIRINSTYLEMVDRWYAPKGWSVFSALLLAPVSIVMFIFGVELFITVRGEAIVWASSIFATSVGAFATWGAWYGFRLEAFRQTHYPIRLNRKTGKVHAYRSDGSILVADWKKLYFCIGESVVPAYGKIYDVRAHLLDKDKETVLDTFTLAYCYMGRKRDISGVWEYIRRYMEDADGPELSWRYSDTCLPVVGRREGVWFGIIAVFAQSGGYPLIQFFGAPVWALIIIGRWIAMFTSKVPAWPEEIEAQYVIEPDDPYQRDWRDNVKFNFMDAVWPVICFVIGLGVLIAAPAWVFLR